MNKVMKAAAALMLSAAVVCAAGCTKPDGPNNGGDNNEGVINGHAYVDLGLPSGTLWATCNVGADIPEKYGDYFAWGETQSKDNYGWDSYQLGIDYNKLTKYCNNPEYGYNGFSDALTTLLPEDDAATANWGNGWRTPTKEEWKELIDHTTQTWTRQNGVDGRLFTAPNGNILFLPVAGYRSSSSFMFDGEWGFYWASTLYSDDPNIAWSFSFYSDNYGMSSANLRYYGRSIRPVCSAK